MKTPEQIASDILSPTIEDVGVAAPMNHSLIYRWIERAIQADRQQRDIYELIAEALDMRAEMMYSNPEPEEAELAARQRRAAQALRDNEGDTAWDDFIGPMLDAMEEEYGR